MLVYESRTPDLTLTKLNDREHLTYPKSQTQGRENLGIYSIV